MKRICKALAPKRWLMSILAALLLVANVIVTIAVCSGGLLNANAASVTTSTLASMKARAEAIVNYEWIPSQDIETWNNSMYNGAAVFPKGSVVKGMPYTLFTYEVVRDSMLSLQQYKSVAASNHFVRAKCTSKQNEWRTGPVYGSCCATFVSEVLGGSFMNGANPRYDSVLKIEASEYAKHIKNAKASQIKPGDALSKKGHIIWVGDVTPSAFVIYEQTPPVARKVIVPKATSINSDGYLVFKGSVYSTITRINVQGSSPSVTAPNVSASYQNYAQNAQAEISWKAISGASYYSIDIFKDGESVVSNEMTFATSYRINRGEGSYEAYVTAWSGSNQAKSKRCCFVIGQLDKPIIATTEKYYPTGSTITVDWNACEGADRYHVNILSDGESVYREADVSAPSDTFAPADGYYELTVDAVNEKGGLQVASSDKYCFYVGNKRPIIIDSSIAYFAEHGAVTVSWNDCEGVTAYTIDICKDNKAYLSDFVTRGQSYTIGRLPNGSYEVCISAVESTGEYEWMPSESYRFTVGRLEQPVVTADRKYYPPDANVSVAWNACEGATGYHVSVTSAEEMLFDEEISGTSFAFDVSKGEYAVVVTAVNDNGGHQESVGKALHLWATSLDLDQPSQRVKPGDTVHFHAVVSSSDITDRVTWSSSDTRILSVDADGNAKAVGLGSASVVARLGELTATRTVDVVPNLSFNTLGASIRLSEPYGIRFGVKLDKDAAYTSTDIVEYGTLLIASGTLGNRELTENADKVRKIKATNLLEEDASHITYTGVLVNIPKSFFQTNVMGRGYLIYRGADGKSYTMYSQTVERSFANVAQAAYDSYSKIENPSAAQVETIDKLKEFLIQ